MQQISNIKEFFKTLFDVQLPVNIIELGTAAGDFTELLYQLRSEYDSNFNLYSFDINLKDKPHVEAISRLPNVNCIEGNIFSNTQVVSDLISKSGLTLLLCDNGDKIREFNIFAPFLKAGDIIMAHDFSLSKQYWESNKYWNWLEITEEDISQTIKEQNLHRFYMNESLKYAWGCYKKQEERIDMTITSCGRPDLLDITLKSFFDLNTYPLANIYLTEDSGDKKIFEGIKEKWGDKVHCIFNDPKKGLTASIDLLNSLTDTKYIFHSEDDWLYENNPNFMWESIKLMPYFNHVWLRHSYDLTHPYSKEIYTYNRIKCRHVEKKFMGIWGGFSFNPGLRRKTDIYRYFPKGLSEFGSEFECAKVVQDSYSACVLTNTAVKHIGTNRHTSNFKN